VQSPRNQRSLSSKIRKKYSKNLLQLFWHPELLTFPATEIAMVEEKVLIIGAGPVGLTLAIELTRFGIPVRIVEKAAQRTDKSKALVL
jgi:heterodisulfide reductase subunit A-like polyferredoxin